MILIDAAGAEAPQPYKSDDPTPPAPQSTKLVKCRTSRRKKKQRHGRRRETWRKYAERHDVSTRTLDRWAAEGIIPPPIVVRKRKYADPDVEPRSDAA